MALQKKILLVDDDVDFVTLNKNILERHGYSVDEAYSASECRKKIRMRKPDAIVLDVMMESTYAGFDLAYELNESEELKDIGIILLTSINKKIQSPWAYEEKKDTWLPVDRIVEKPLEPEKLLALVNNLFEG